MCFNLDIEMFPVVHHGGLSNSEAAVLVRINNNRISRAHKIYRVHTFLLKLSLLTAAVFK